MLRPERSAAQKTKHRKEENGSGDELDLSKESDARAMAILALLAQMSIIR